jgi:hypothetical protein
MPSPGSTSTRVYLCRSPSSRVSASPPASAPVAVLSCCTPALPANRTGHALSRRVTSQNLPTMLPLPFPHDPAPHRAGGRQIPGTVQATVTTAPLPQSRQFRGLSEPRPGTSHRQRPMIPSLGERPTLPMSERAVKCGERRLWAPAQPSRAPSSSEDRRHFRSPLQQLSHWCYQEEFHIREIVRSRRRTRNRARPPRSAPLGAEAPGGQDRGDRT